MDNITRQPQQTSEWRSSELQDSVSSPAPPYQSIQSSPPPDYAVPQTPRSVTQLGQSIAQLSHSLNLRRVWPSPRPHAPTMSAPQPQPAEVHADDVSSTIQADSRGAARSLTRRRRHESLRGVSQPAPVPPPEEYHRYSIPSTMRSTAMPPELLQEVGNTQSHQHIRSVLTEMLPPQSPSPPPQPAAHHGYATDSSIPDPQPPTRMADFEGDRPPSTGSIASTAISPELLVQRAVKERELEEIMMMMEFGRHGKGSQAKLFRGEGERSGVSAPNSSMRSPVAEPSRPRQNHQVSVDSSMRSPPRSPVSQPQRAPSTHSSRSHKPGSHHSHRSYTVGPSSLAPADPDLLHPDQAAPASRASLESYVEVATPLSYASLRPEEEQVPLASAKTPPLSSFYPSTYNHTDPTPPLHQPLSTRQYHETPSHTTTMQPSPKGQSGRDITPGHAESRNPSTLDSPRRSIPRHDSPEGVIVHVNLGPGTDPPSTPTPSSPQQLPPVRTPTLRRRNRESIVKAGPELSQPQFQLTPPKTRSARYSEEIVINPDFTAETAEFYYNPRFYSEGVSAGSQPRSRRRSEPNSPGSQSTGVSLPAKALLLPNNSPPERTMNSVRRQVATEIALRAVTKSSTIDGMRIGIADASSASKPNDIPFLHLIAHALISSFTLSTTPYLFLLTTSSTSPTTPGILYITSSSHRTTSRAATLASAKFLHRVTHAAFTSSSPSGAYTDPGSINAFSLTATPGFGQPKLPTKELEWCAHVRDLHASPFDADVLQSLLLSAARAPLDPARPPPDSRGIAVILEEQRARLERVTARGAFSEVQAHALGGGSGRGRGGVDGSGLLSFGESLRALGGGVGVEEDPPVVLVDIRPQKQREEWGHIPGALVVERNVLEWRFDPRCEARLAIADRYDLRVIVFCQEGYTSSLAAFSLRQLGLLNATDMIGGYKAWKDAKLPVDIKPSRERSLASAAGSIV